MKDKQTRKPLSDRAKQAVVNALTQPVGVRTRPPLKDGKTSVKASMKVVEVDQETINNMMGLRWTKYVIHMRTLAELCLGMPIAMVLRKHSYGLYFARYTDLPARIEIQVFHPNTEGFMRKQIEKVCRVFKVRPLRIAVEKCNGSHLHAQAFDMALWMEKQGINTLAMIQDVTHWLTNMLGFSYIQEAEGLIRHLHVCVSNVGGASYQKPVFPNPTLPKTPEPQTAVPNKPAPVAAKKKSRS